MAPTGRSRYDREEQTMPEINLGVTAEVDAERFHRFLDLYEKAWAEPASGQLADLWAPDAEMMHPEFTEPMQGRDAVMAYLGEILKLAPDLQVRPLAAAANGDMLFIHFRGEGTFAGKKVVWEGVDRFELDGDHAIRGLGFFDTGTIRAALEGASS
jgi:predicted SnoaL-like aldol condensation-catalyzing enzyme